MNAKNLAIVAIALWLGGAAVIANMFIGGNTEQGSDGREAVVLKVGERDFILTEMRQMLASVQEIVSAVAEDDMKSVSENALAIGTAEVRNMPKALMLKLPRGFKTMGKETHVGFDQVEAQAKNGGKAVLTSLGNLMGGCVACHETFSLKAK